MNKNSLICHNSLLNPESFIDNLLYPRIKEHLPTCELQETADFYYIDINSFYDNKHLLEISYKDNFLILTIMLNNTLKEFLLQRVFYLSRVDLNNILLHDYKNSITIILSKIS